MGLFGSGALFEAGAVASLGLVWSLRRLQRRWEGEREKWEAGVREEGRRVLKAAEDRMRGIVESGARPRKLRDEGLEERVRVREAVERCREIMARVGR
ncbi:hypothetical protein LTS18_004212 [Coniosporium uncinatum]|uniref:Uncharacterized protein n=1 Tax=Coniosporium uncinatum TaxID=93489 RepID=A0ACC3DBW4_9PEZI|nr:hypothetical protein LTS18_004212 [Coniosporium uncinatum]